MKRNNFIRYIFDEEEKYKVEFINSDGSHTLNINDKTVERINKGKTDLMNYDYKFYVGNHECILVNCLWSGINPTLYVDGYAYDSKDERNEENKFQGVPERDVVGLIYIVLSALILLITLCLVCYYNKFDLGIIISVIMVPGVIFLLFLSLYKYPFRYNRILKLNSKTIRFNKTFSKSLILIVMTLILICSLFFSYHIVYSF